jgi:hypothetical protein
MSLICEGATSHVDLYVMLDHICRAGAAALAPSVVMVVFYLVPDTVCAAEAATAAICCLMLLNRML